MFVVNKWNEYVFQRSKYKEMGECDNSCDWEEKEMSVDGVGERNGRTEQGPAQLSQPIRPAPARNHISHGSHHIGNEPVVCSSHWACQAAYNPRLRVV